MNRASDHRIDQLWDETTLTFPSRPVIVNDWSLLAGFHVQVRLNWWTLRSGRVEEVTRDGNALWIEAGSGFGRQLIDQGSGFQILVDPHQLAILGQRHAASARSDGTPKTARK